MGIMGGGLQTNSGGRLEDKRNGKSDECPMHEISMASTHKQIPMEPINRSEV